MRKIFLVLLLFPLYLFGQSNQSALTLLADGGAPPVTPTPLTFYHDNVTVSDGSANIFVLAPTGYDNAVPIDGWPVIIFTSGDGTSGNNTFTDSGISMSTGDNLTYSVTRDLYGFRMMVSTVVIKVNGTPAAWGRIGATIIGPGVTGNVTNFDHDSPGTNSSPTITVTFDSSQSGNTITCDYVRSSMFIEGVPRWVNFGDSLDNRVIFIAIQNVQGYSDFDMDYFDKAVQYAWTNFTINPNRISCAGISRGGRAILDSPGFLHSRYQFWIDDATGVVYTSAGTGRTKSGIASVVTGTASYSTGTPANYTEVGISCVHGYPDYTLTNNTPTFAGSLGGNNEPPFIFNIIGAGHDANVWDGKCYKRLYRQGGATGSLTTAPWDYLDFLLKYSKDSVERATLFVEQVEKRRFGTEKDIIDYRHAARQVAALGAGSFKTALEGRLTTVKSAIDGSGQRWVINFYSSGNNESGNYVNFSGTTSGSIVSNIVDFDGSSTSVDIELDIQTDLGMETISTSRRTYTGGFSKIANNSGLLTNNWPIGRLLFTDLPTGTYTLRLYANKGDAVFTNDPEFYTTVNSVNKQSYTVLNTLMGYIEYTGLSQTQVAQIDIAKISGGNPAMTILELYKHP